MLYPSAGVVRIESVGHGDCIIQYLIVQMRTYSAVQLLQSGSRWLVRAGKADGNARWLVLGLSAVARTRGENGERQKS